MAKFKFMCENTIFIRNNKIKTSDKFNPIQNDKEIIDFMGGKGRYKYNFSFKTEKDFSKLYYDFLEIINKYAPSWSWYRGVFANGTMEYILQNFYCFHCYADKKYSKKEILDLLKSMEE